MKEKIPAKILDLTSLRPAAEQHVASEKAAEQRALDSTSLRAERILGKGYTPPTEYDKAVLEQDRKRVSGLSIRQLARMLDEEQEKPGTYSEMQKFAMAEALVRKLDVEQE